MNQKQVKNACELTDQMITHRNCNLCTLSENENIYNRYHRMLAAAAADGSLKNVVDVEKFNVSLLANSSQCFKDKQYAVILHDPSGRHAVIYANPIANNWRA